MPKASDIIGYAKPKFICYGNIGSGKTTLFRTIPGKKFLYMFDPAGLNSIKQNDDIEFELFVPNQTSMSVVSLKKRGDAIIKDSDVSYSGADTYKRFEADFIDRLNKGWFQANEITAIGFDSFTTLSDIVMDQVLQMNNRPGKQPEQDDWAVQMNTLRNVVRNAAATDAIIYFTAHEELVQDKLSRAVSNQIIATGKLKQKLPLLFSDIFHCKADLVGQQVKYSIETVPSEMYPLARCSMNLNPTVDVTIPPNASDPTIYGLGKILREKGIIA